MAVTTFRQLSKLVAYPSQRIHYTRNGSISSMGTVSESGLQSDWNSSNSMPTAGAAPGAAAVPTNATAGAAGQQNPSGGSLYAFLERYKIATGGNTTPGILMLVDRLAHNSTLSGIVTTAQSNGAWPALTRYTNGIGVWAAVQIYTAIGATQTTVTASYTNDAGTAGRTSQPVKIGGTGRNAARRILPLSLQAGDKGIKSVASITVLASTLTAGDIGVTLFKTLAMWPVNVLPYIASGRPLPNFGSIAPVVNGACLELIYLGQTGVGGSFVGGTLGFFEA